MSKLRKREEQEEEEDERKTKQKITKLSLVIPNAFNVKWCVM